MAEAAADATLPSTTALHLSSNVFERSAYACSASSGISSPNRLYLRRSSKASIMPACCDTAAKA